MLFSLSALWSSFEYCANQTLRYRYFSHDDRLIPLLVCPSFCIELIMLWHASRDCMRNKPLLLLLLLLSISAQGIGTFFSFYT